MYNSDNIFAKILKKDILVQSIYEDEYCLSFYDIKPCRKIHVLVISKDSYISFDDFITKSTDKKISYFWKGVFNTIKLLNISKSGYRLITNHGINSGQEIFHFHVHIIGGELIGPLVIPKNAI